jgi:hypothetical protein
MERGESPVRKKDMISALSHYFPLCGSKNIYATTVAKVLVKTHIFEYHLWQSKIYGKMIIVLYVETPM